MCVSGPAAFALPLPSWNSSIASGHLAQGQKKWRCFVNSPRLRPGASQHARSLFWGRWTRSCSEKYANNCTTSSRVLRNQGHATHVCCADNPFERGASNPQSQRKAHSQDAALDPVRRSKEVRDTKDSLWLHRRDVEPAAGRAGRPRAVRIERSSTLGGIGVIQGETSFADYESGISWNSAMLELEKRVPIDASIVVHQIRGGYRVVGKVNTRVRRSCDRCLGLYETDVDGQFEVWLDPQSGTGYGEVPESAEAVEDFVGNRAKVDLAPHVRDAVLLGLPSKALCGPSCEGMSTDSIGEVEGISVHLVADGVSGGGDLDGRSDNVAAAPASGDELRALKKKLEDLKRSP